MDPTLHVRDGARLVPLGVLDALGVVGPIPGDSGVLGRSDRPNGWRRKGEYEVGTDGDVDGRGGVLGWES